MRIVDAAALERMRQLPACECCGKKNRVGLHAAHLISRGAGGSDVAEGLNGLCAACHHAWHSGKIRRHELLTIIAKREGRTVGEIETILYALVRKSRKDTQYAP